MDLIFLRVLPPIITGAILYYAVGLNVSGLHDSSWLIDHVLVVFISALCFVFFHIIFSELKMYFRLLKTMYLFLFVFFSVLFSSYIFASCRVAQSRHLLPSSHSDFGDSHWPLSWWGGGNPNQCLFMGLFPHHTHQSSTNHPTLSGLSAFVPSVGVGSILASFIILVLLLLCGFVLVGWLKFIHHV